VTWLAWLFSAHRALPLHSVRDGKRADAYALVDHAVWPCRCFPSAVDATWRAFTGAWLR